MRRGTDDAPARGRLVASRAAELLSALGALVVVGSATQPWFAYTLAGRDRVENHVAQLLAGLLGTAPPQALPSARLAPLRLVDQPAWGIGVLVLAAAMAAWIVARAGSGFTRLGSSGRIVMVVAAAALVVGVGAAVRFGPTHPTIGVVGVPLELPLERADWRLAYGALIGGGGAAATLVGAILRVLIA
jgi:hypothetical protein